jgi:GNAT superfamily N-acetyltransferase
MEEDTAAFAVACVLPQARGQGVGTAIYRQVSSHARELDKSELMTWGYEDDAGGVAFAELYGFTIVKRNRGLRLVLDGCPRPTVDLPDEITITTLADSPALARGVWETASEAMPDIPYYTVPMSAGSFDEFAARSFSGPKYIPEATFIAVREREVVGYAQLVWMSRAAGIVDHAMLAVRRAWRGHGIAKALKARQIMWALDNDLTELRTANDERNSSARAVNANFAYTPLPEQIGYRGPLLADE